MTGGYSLILWDFDGTLCDTFGAIEASVIGSGITKPEEVSFLMDCFKNGATLSQAFTLLLENRYQKNPTHLSSYNTEPFIKEIDHLCRQYREAYPVFGRKNEFLFSDTLPTLEAFHKKGIKQVIVSNKSEDELVDAVDRFHLTRYFFSVLGSRTDMPFKPDPKVFEKRIAPLLLGFFQETSLHRQEILMIGDTIVDVQFGNAIGCDTVLIKRSKFIKSDILSSLQMEPTFLINNLNELIL
jgi:phosphoglycolate phosphatase-like HAD superfamily hydrolase